MPLWWHWQLSVCEHAAAPCLDAANCNSMNHCMIHGKTVPLMLLMATDYLTKYFHTRTPISYGWNDIGWLNSLRKQRDLEAKDIKTPMICWTVNFLEWNVPQAAIHLYHWHQVASNSKSLTWWLSVYSSCHMQIGSLPCLLGRKKQTVMIPYRSAWFTVQCTHHGPWCSPFPSFPLPRGPNWMS